jgi:hypothetical protein
MINFLFKKKTKKKNIMATSILTSHTSHCKQLFSETIPETIINNKYKIGIIASIIFGSAVFAVTDGALSLAVVIPATIIGTLNYWIITLANNYCLSIIKFCSKNFFRVTTSSLEKRAKFNAAIDTVSSSTTLKAIQISVNIIFSCISTASLSCLVMPPICISSFLLVSGLCLFKIGKISTHILESYSLRKQRSLLEEKHFSNDSWMGKTKRLWHEWINDKPFPVYEVPRDDPFSPDPLHPDACLFSEAIYKYRNSIPKSEAAKLLNKIENFDPEVYQKIACFIILEILGSTPSPGLFMRIFRSHKYPSIIPSVDSPLLKNIYIKFNRLCDKEKKEVIQKILGNIDSGNTRATEVFEDIKKFTPKLLQNNSDFGENMSRASIVFALFLENIGV